MTERNMTCSLKDTFYFDQSVEGCESLKARAVRLGLKIKGFLGDGVTVCVTADVKSERATEEAAAGSLRGRRTNRIHRMMVQAQAVPRAVKGQELDSSMTDRACELGAAIMSCQVFRMWLEGQESKVTSGTASTSKGKAPARPLISRIPRAGTDRFKSQKHPRIVIKDLDRLEPDRVQAFPPELLRKCVLHEDAPPGICPFTPREQWDREVLKLSKKDAQYGVGQGEGRAPPGPQRPRRGGWCECCEKQYIGTMSEHCARGEHRAAVAADPNFAALLALQSWTATDGAYTKGDDVGLQDTKEQEETIIIPAVPVAATFNAAGDESVAEAALEARTFLRLTENVPKNVELDDHLPADACAVRLKTAVGRVQEQALLRNCGRVIDAHEKDAVMENSKYRVEGGVAAEAVKCSVPQRSSESTSARCRKGEHKLDTIMATNENIDRLTSVSRPQMSVDAGKANAPRSPLHVCQIPEANGVSPCTENRERKWERPLRVCQIPDPNDVSPCNKIRGDKGVDLCQRDRQSEDPHVETPLGRHLAGTPPAGCSNEAKSTCDAKGSAFEKTSELEAIAAAAEMPVVDSHVRSSHDNGGEGSTSTLQPVGVADSRTEECDSLSPVLERRKVQPEQLRAKGEVTPSSAPVASDEPDARSGAPSSSRKDCRKKRNRELQMLADTPEFVSARNRLLSSASRGKRSGGSVGGSRSCDGERDYSLSTSGINADIAGASPEAANELGQNANGVKTCASSSGGNGAKGRNRRASKASKPGGNGAKERNRRASKASKTSSRGQGRPEVSGCSLADNKPTKESLHRCEIKSIVKPKPFDAAIVPGTIGSTTGSMATQIGTNKSLAELKGAQNREHIDRIIIQRGAPRHGCYAVDVASSPPAVENNAGVPQGDVSLRSGEEYSTLKKHRPEKSNGSSESGDASSPSPATFETCFSKGTRRGGDSSPGQTSASLFSPRGTSTTRKSERRRALGCPATDGTSQAKRTREYSEGRTSSGMLDSGSSANGTSSSCEIKKRQRGRNGLRTLTPTTTTRMGLQSESDNELVRDGCEGSRDEDKLLSSGLRQERTPQRCPGRGFEEGEDSPGRNVSAVANGHKGAARNPVNVPGGFPPPMRMRAQILTDSTSTQSGGWRPTRVS